MRSVRARPRCAVRGGAWLRGVTGLGEYGAGTAGCGAVTEPGGGQEVRNSGRENDPREERVLEERRKMGARCAGGMLRDGGAELCVRSRR